MADTRTGRFGRDQESISIAVRLDRFQLQKMAGGLTFRPKLLPGTAEEGYVTSSDGYVKRFTIHKADHQDALRACVLNNRRNEAIVFVEI